MAGIEQSKKLLSELAAAAKEIELVLEDGKVSLLDLRHAPALFADVKAAVDALSGVKEELKDLDKDELQELLQMVIDMGLELAAKLEPKA